MNPKHRLPLLLLLSSLLSVPAAASSEGTFQRTLKVAGAVNLEIETGSGSIDVRTGAGDQVQVTGHIRAANWLFGGGRDVEEKIKRIQDNPPIQQSGNDIRIGHIDDPSLRRNVSISYEVVVPAATRLRAHSGSGDQSVMGIEGPLDIEAGSGAIKASQIGSAVRAETGSGNIEIDGAKGNVRARAGSGSIRAMNVSGGFDGETGSGDVALQQTSPGAVRVDTGSGGVELRGVRGSLQAKTGSGSIRADGDPNGGWNLHSGSGSVKLKLSSTAAFDLDAHTGSGSIYLNHPVTVQGEIGKKEIKGKVRGGGVPVEVETGSGSIEIE